MAGDWSEEITHVAGTDLAIIKGGQGKPLLVLHEEMGHPGWLSWHAALAKERTLMIPIQPGFGKSPRVEAIRNVHELGLFYSWVLRDMNLAPIDVIGFSLGGWAAAEMATRKPATVPQDGAGRAVGNQTARRRNLRHLRGHAAHAA